MKQHITIDQLNELSEKGKERLREWLGTVDTLFWDEKRKLLISNKGYIDVDTKTPLLSIGQMIEFLDEHDYFMDGIVKLTTGGWAINYLWGENEQVGDELCDALWGAVKEVLDNQE